ncbi:MAG: sugar phosphate isomerase/epimerase [Clostridia bacterium]|nr:sugar phosphate isomerase/epimerase [Clostridia bacterium]
MLLSSNMIRLYDVFGLKETFDLLAETGYQGIDFNNDKVPYSTDQLDEQFYRKLRQYADQKGIAICQSHAPGPSSYPEAEKTEEAFKRIVQGMKNASYLGAPMIVVHPCTHLDYMAEGNAEIMFNFNLDFYRRLIPYAREFGIKIAIENLYYSATGTAESINRLYDELNDPVFTICFDVGHCLLQHHYLQGDDPATAIRKIGHRLVDGCTHIHDNSGEIDAHTLPYYGNVDWESVMKALADIGYKGDFSYEASSFFKDVPPALRADSMAYMAKVGRYLISRFEYYQNQQA